MDERSLIKAELERRGIHVDDDASWGENLIGGIGRTAAGIPGQFLDVPLLPFNIIQAVRRQPGFSFSEKGKELYDIGTQKAIGKNYKATTELGRAAETAGDLIGPAFLARFIPKIAGKVSSKIANTVGKVENKASKLANEIPGLTGKVVRGSGKVLGATAGSKAINRVIENPTIGNMVGSGVTHRLNETDEEPEFIKNTIGGTGLGLLTDIGLSGIKHGGKKIASKTRQGYLKDEDVHREVDRLVAEQSLNKIKKQQKESDLKEKLEHHKQQKQERLTQAEQAEREKGRYQLPEELRESIQEKTNAQAGHKLNEQAKVVKAEKEAHFNPVYEERNKFFDTMYDEPLVSLDQNVKHYQDLYARCTSKAAKKAFWEGPDGKMRMEVLGIGPKSSLSTKEKALFNPRTTSFHEAKRFLDLTTGVKGHPEITSGATSNIKHDASLITKEIDTAFEQTHPGLAAKIEKINPEYGHYRGTTGEAINKTRENKYNPATAAKVAESQLATDPHIHANLGTKEVSLNTLRNLGMDEFGNFDPKKAAKELVVLDPEARSAILKPLDKNERKLVSQWMRDYKQEGIEAKAPKTEPTKFESTAAKPYNKQGVEGFGSYVESLTPEQQKSMRADASAIDILKKEQQMRRSKTKDESPFKQYSVNAGLGKLWRAAHGSSLIHKAPNAAEEITRLSNIPPHEHNLLKRGLSEAGTIAKGTSDKYLGSMTRETNKKRPLIQVWGDEPYISPDMNERELIRQELEKRGVLIQ
jgi:hypothetical protein